MITLAILLFFGGFFRFIFGVIWIILVVAALLDLFKAVMPTNTKLLWLIIILVAPIFGSLIYLFWGKYQRI
ncbi:MAG TPA: PLDc N-terminal domain-containing protein [Daejeonella sp.]|nr:PLDc N-terminal domain-containing protein [Daejeonella sp.]